MALIIDKNTVFEDGAFKKKQVEVPTEAVKPEVIKEPEVESKPIKEVALEEIESTTPLVAETQ